ncbi:MAG: hypothetical protein Q9161_004166 [Pseudevernia consocians]
MEYRPISSKDREIRVITILTRNDDACSAESPILCTLEHVSLDKKSRKATESAKGAERVWPEAFAKVDTKELWKPNHLDPSTADLGTTAPKLTQVGLDMYSDGKSPWRFAWGDYVALSYCWGDAQTTREIIIDGRSIHVTLNLEAALRQLRGSHCIKQGFKLWVDAICIDQGNLEERGQQVARMRDIYASAWHVVIWLGVDANDSSLAMTAVKYFSDCIATEKSPNMLYRTSKAIDARPLFVIWSSDKSSIRKEVYRALYHLLTRPYWRRLWILQEVALGGQGSPVLCGSACVLWGDIYKASCFLEMDENRSGRDILASVKPRISVAWSWEFASARVPYNDGLETSTEFLWKFPLSLTSIQQDQHDSNTDSFRDATKLFNLSLDAKVTDQKDRVFGILGIAGISSLTEIEPNYLLPLKQVYVNFSKDLLARGGLDTLRFVQSPIAEINRGWTSNTVGQALNLEPLVTKCTKGKSQIVASHCTHNLPSWVICWVCPRGRTAQLHGQYSVDGGELESNAAFEDDRVLRTKGILFDTVNSLSSFHTAETSSKFPFNGKPNPSAYGDIIATKEALWRTLVGDTTQDGAWAPESYSLLLQSEIWEDGIAGVKFNNFGLHNFMTRNANLSVFGCSLKKIVFSSSKWFSNGHRKLYNPTVISREAVSWATNVMAWRRLITTEKGYLGLAIAATEPKDRVCILVGCKTPLILRPHDNYFRVIGECYIHGIMRGEIAKDIRDAQLQIKDILLC